MSSKRKTGTETRHDILDAAWDLIAEHGADASVAQIATAAGVSRQAIYMYFNNRGGLLIALVRRADERFEIHRRLGDSLTIGDPAQRLDAAVSAWLDFVPEILPVARDLIRLKPTDEDARRAWEDRMDELRIWMKTVTETLQRDGALATGWQVDDAADFLWTLTSVNSWSLLVDECGWPPNKAKNRIRTSAATVLLDIVD